MKNLTKIANIVVLSILIGLSMYQYDRISSLGNEARGIKIEQNKDYLSIKELFTKSQEKKNHLNITVQKKVFNQEIAEAKKILSKKLKIEEDRIYFEDLKFSITWEEVTGISLFISGACDVDTHSCESFTVDIETGVISKF